MAFSLSELLSMGNKGCYYAFNQSKSYDDPDILKIYEDQIREKVGVSSDARWSVAFSLAHLLRSGAWVAYYDRTISLYNQWSEDNIGSKLRENPYYPVGGNWFAVDTIHYLTFLKEKFGLGRTTVYNYLEVVDRFSTYIEEEGKEAVYSINAEAKQFQFWQLVEMTSLTYQERLKVQPNWTREEIRAYKRSLKEKARASIQPAEQVEAEEKPMSEAQQRFAKYSKDDLIDLVLKLEKEQSDIATKYNELIDRVQPFSGNNDLVSKRELTNVIVGLLNSYNYEIRLNGRKQGFSAFAGVVAKTLLENNKNESNTAVFSFGGEAIEDKIVV